MLTPVTLTCTGQSYELTVLTRALREKPLCDPVTGQAISSNAMEIDFDLQNQIEEYKRNMLSVECVSDDLKEVTVDEEKVTPTAPPVDFALKFLSDFSDSDDEGVNSSNDQTNVSGDTSSMKKSIEGTEENVKEVVDSGTVTCKPPDMQVKTNSSRKSNLAFDYEPRMKVDESSDGEYVPYTDFTQSLESVSFRGPPASWSFSMGHPEIVYFLLARNQNEYADRKLLSNASVSTKRARALCRRFPFMWGYETELKCSSQTVVSHVAPKGMDNEDKWSDSPVRPYPGPLGTALNHRLPKTGDNPRNAASLMCREGGNTALHVAVWNGHYDVVRILVEAGACLESKNGNNLTPLMIACRHGHFDIVKFLLEHGSPYRAIRKEDICSQGKMDDFQVKKQISAILNAHRRKAGLSYLR